MKAVKRAIILCWIMLIVCFIIKLFGGNWFEIICNNEHFINICTFIDGNQILRHTIALPLYIIPTFFVMLACCLIDKPNFKQAIVILSFIIVVWATNFIATIAKMIAEIVMFLVLPFITRTISIEKENWRLRFRKTWYLGIIGCVLSLSFQIISLLVKNIGIKVIDDSVLTSIIFSLDYYIMIALYYLYVKLKIRNKKE